MLEIAENSGFCFGVSRAIKIVEDLLDCGKKVYTLGEIIHNKQVCENLKLRGVNIIEDIYSLNRYDNLVIRSHGVGPKVYIECEKLGIQIFDATCPFVKRIHKIVKDQSSLGKTIIIIGNSRHPEVCGIKKYGVKGRVFIFSNLSEIETLVKDGMEEFALVVQTTYDSAKWEQEIVKYKNFSNLTIFNTICSATATRQKYAMELAKIVDLMIVVGGKNSSNSRKLVDLCSKFCKTVFVENYEEFSCFLEDNKLPKNIGLTAGASTPLYVVDEIYNNIKNII